MRIVFIGSVRFSAGLLEALVKIDADIAAVCTLKSAPANSDHTDLTKIAEQAGIPAIYADNINDPAVIGWIREYKPDVIFCFGWSRLIKRPLLDVAPLGVVGYHPSHLPANRGRHPLIWALALGMPETASTFFFMDEGADSGDILSQRTISITADDDAGTLYARMLALAIEQLHEIVPALECGRYCRIRQDEGKASYWRKRTRLDGEIDWRMSAKSIHDLVRALRPPYPGAHFMFDEREIKVWRTEVVTEQRCNIEPGKILAATDSTITVKVGMDAIRIVEYTPRIRVQAGDYL